MRVGPCSRAVVAAIRGPVTLAVYSIENKDAAGNVMQALNKLAEHIERHGLPVTKKQLKQLFPLSEL